MMLKRLISTVVFTIGQVAKRGKKYQALILLDVIRRVIVSLIMVVVPAKIVQYLLEIQYDKAQNAAVILCLVFCCSEITAELVMAGMKEIEAEIQIDISTQFCSAILNEEYEKTENKSYLDKVEFGNKCIERKSVLKVHHNLMEMLIGVINLSGIFYILRNMNFKILLLIIMVVVINAIGEIFRMKYVYNRERNGSDIERNLYYARNDLAGNKYAKDIRIWNLYNYINNKVELYAKKLCELWVETAAKTVKIVGWTYVANGIQYVVIYLFLAYSTYKGYMDVNEFVLYSSATVVFGEALKMIINAILKTSAENQYIDGIMSIVETSNVVQKKEKFFPMFNQTIEFEDVWYKYAGAEEYTIEGLSFCLKKNQSYCLVGKNGAGKTTLVKLLLGLYKPDKGRILIDGVPTDEIDPIEYRKLFACVFQDFNIWGFSVRENITLSQIVDERKMRKVIEHVGLAGKISSLKDDFDTMLNREINENAVTFSGGQEQQLAIARALYRESPIYVLDEPTAALSPNSEYALYHQCYRSLENKTVLFVSHRLASCVLCDEIIVLEKGRIIERGSHEKLIKEEGMYADMFNSQTRPYFE